MKKNCEYQGHYLDWDDDIQEEVDVFKCKAFTDKGVWDNVECYCTPEERDNCMLYKYLKMKDEENKND